jgi:HSP20 family protein
MANQGRETFPNLLYPLEAVQNQMNRLFNSVGRWPMGSDSNSDWMSQRWMPAIDIEEDKDRVMVEVEVPGLSKDDLNVFVQGGELVIQGEKKQEKRGKENGWSRSERSFGSFYRSVSLPSGIDESRAEANYKNGVLELSFPKKEEARPKSINIQVKGN